MKFVCFDNQFEFSKVREILNKNFNAFEVNGGGTLFFYVHNLVTCFWTLLSNYFFPLKLAPHIIIREFLKLQSGH